MSPFERFLSFLFFTVWGSFAILAVWVIHDFIKAVS